MKMIRVKGKIRAAKPRRDLALKRHAVNGSPAQNDTSSCHYAEPKQGGVAAGGGAATARRRATATATGRSGVARLVGDQLYIAFAGIGARRFGCAV